MNKRQDFTRVIWSNKAETWRKIIARVSNDWLDFEQLLVHEGHRVAFITQVLPIELIEFSQKWHSYGCQAIPLGMVGISNTYASRSVPIKDGKFQYRVLVYKANRVVRLEYNDTFIGKLLGYPDCCIKFFEKVWNCDEVVDTTWPMFKNSETLSQKCNILLRYIGIRPVFHLPCAFDCDASIVLANNNLGYFKQYYPESAEVLDEILQWPVEWSAINGVAEIKFPLGKISARTDIHKDKRIVRLEGTRYPIDGETGTVFPYNRRKDIMNTTNLKLVIKPKNGYEINGFVHEMEQQAGHEWLVNEFNKYAHELNLESYKFMDLGAGNGDLVKKLNRLYPHLRGLGIDKDIENSDVVKCNIRDVSPNNYKADIALIAEQRFTDTYKNIKEAVEHIFKFANNIFVYNYSTREAWLIAGANHEEAEHSTTPHNPTNIM